MLRTQEWLGVFAGIALYVALMAIAFLFNDRPPPDTSSRFLFWYNAHLAVVQSLSSVAPGFVAGWLAQRRGLLIGALVGTGAAVASPMVTVLFWGSMPFSAVIAVVLIGVVTASLTQAVAGVAGEVLRARLRSNPPLKEGRAKSGAPLN